MVTRITIDLTDQEVRDVRYLWCPSDRRRSSTDIVKSKVHAALPPVRIEPKVGGTCQLKYEPNDRHNILYVDEHCVLVRHHLAVVDPGFAVGRGVFDTTWEVLS